MVGCMPTCETQIRRDGQSVTGDVHVQLPFLHTSLVVLFASIFYASDIFF